MSLKSDSGNSTLVDNARLTSSALVCSLCFISFVALSSFLLLFFSTSFYNLSQVVGFKRAVRELNFAA